MCHWINIMATQRGRIFNPNFKPFILPYYKLILKIQSTSFLKSCSWKTTNCTGKIRGLKTCVAPKPVLSFSPYCQT